MKNSVLYSHEAHLKAGCSCEDCHDDLFEKEFGKARFSMSDVNKGKACGVCHQVKPPAGVKAAFPPRNRETRENNCEKCHSIRVREPTKRRR